jgi:response regulator RpfG family c-di-GMP phosphodiesterase
MTDTVTVQIIMANQRVDLAVEALRKANGVEILKSLRQFAPIIPAILHYHERYDGSGYPMGLSGERIPL